MSNSERMGKLIVRWVAKGIRMGVPAVMKMGNFRGGRNGQRLTTNPGTSNKGPPGYYIDLYVNLTSSKT